MKLARPPSTRRKPRRSTRGCSRARSPRATATRSSGRTSSGSRGWATRTPPRARRLRAGAMHHRDWILTHERRTRLRWAWREFFDGFDALLCPIACIPAFPHDQQRDMDARRITVNGEVREYWDQLFWAGLTGVAFLPATVAPAASEGPPHRGADRGAGRRRPRDNRDCPPARGPHRGIPAASRVCMRGRARRGIRPALPAPRNDRHAPSGVRSGGLNRLSRKSKYKQVLRKQHPLPKDSWLATNSCLIKQLNLSEGVRPVRA